MLFIATAMAAS